MRAYGHAGFLGRGMSGLRCAPLISNSGSRHTASSTAGTTSGWLRISRRCRKEYRPPTALPGGGGGGRGGVADGGGGAAGGPADLAEVPEGVPPPDGVAVERVRDEAGLADWVEALGSGFGEGP